MWSNHCHDVTMNKVVLESEWGFDFGAGLSALVARILIYLLGGLSNFVLG